MKKNFISAVIVTSILLSFASEAVAVCVNEFSGSTNKVCNAALMNPVAVGCPLNPPESPGMDRGHGNDDVTCTQAAAIEYARKMNLGFNHAAAAQSAANVYGSCVALGICNGGTCWTNANDNKNDDHWTHGTSDTDTDDKCWDPVTGSTIYAGGCYQRRFKKARCDDDEEEDHWEFWIECLPVIDPVTGLGCFPESICTDDDRECVEKARMTDGGCIEQPGGKNCTDKILDFYEPSPRIGNLSGEWQGDCSGRGFFENNSNYKYRLDSNNNVMLDNNGNKIIDEITWDNAMPYDIWPSRTGCYNPEERFSEVNYNFWSKKTQRIPRDYVLNLHPDCIEYKSGKDVKIQQLHAGEDGYDLICLYDDILDDIDAFCDSYVNDTFRGKEDSMINTADVMQKGKYMMYYWFWKPKGKPLTAAAKEGCWGLYKQPAVAASVPEDRWFPVATRLVDGSSVYTVEQSQKYGNLGKYGFVSSSREVFAPMSGKDIKGYFFGYRLSTNDLIEYYFKQIMEGYLAGVLNFNPVAMLQEISSQAVADAQRIDTLVTQGLASGGAFLTQQVTNKIMQGAVDYIDVEVTDGMDTFLPDVDNQWLDDRRTDLVQGVADLATGGLQNKTNQVQQLIVDTQASVENAYEELKSPIVDAFSEDFTGEMIGGYQNKQIQRVIINPSDGDLNPHNIYNLSMYAGPDLSTPINQARHFKPKLDPQDDDIQKWTNNGRRWKKYSCLKLYIEEWAHVADCKSPVLDDAPANVSIASCQWVEQYNTMERGGTVRFEQMHFVPNNGGIVWNKGSSIPTFGLAKAKRFFGLRSEHFDYANFNAKGWLTNHYEISGGITGALADICDLPKRPGDGLTFNPATPMTDAQVALLKKGTKNKKLPGSITGTPLNPGPPSDVGLDFSKRRCPTISGPDEWPDVFDKCRSDQGYRRIDDPVSIMAQISSFKIPSLTTNIHSVFSTAWGLSTGGKAVPGTGTVVPFWDEDHAFVPIPLFEDWVDFSWPARDCTHNTVPILGLAFTDPDNWLETPDIVLKLSQGVFQTVYGFPLLEADATNKPKWLHNSKYNPLQWQHAHWCEFEVPYSPFTSGWPIDVNGILNPLINLFAGESERRWWFMKGEHFVSHININTKLPALNTDPDKHGAIMLNFPQVERIRDACGAFSQRADWIIDENGLALFMSGMPGRCDHWEGLYRRKYVAPKIISWRLPRFNYEFLKAFIQCTGPVREHPKGTQVCSGPGRLGSYKIALNNLVRAENLRNAHHYFDAVDVVVRRDDITRPASGFWKNGKEAFGFWCDCEKDFYITSKCDESYCTCQQKYMTTYDMIGGPANPAALIAIIMKQWKKGIKFAPNLVYHHGVRAACVDYGPFKRWLQCYHQARAKACPVLVRDVSSGITPSVLLEKAHDPQNIPATRKHICMNLNDINDPTDDTPGEDEYVSPYPPHLRWQGPEPNILAKLPVTADPGAIDDTGYFRKHHDLVFRAQVRDVEAPFMEITVPLPLELKNYTGAVQRLSLDTLKDMTVEPKTAIDIRHVSTHPAVTRNAINKFYAGVGVQKMAYAITEPSTEHKPSIRALDVIVGPRGCDIGGWYEMLLYQARCIRFFRLACLCDYNKTFINGSAEDYVLKRAGMSFYTAKGKIAGKYIGGEFKKVNGVSTFVPFTGGATVWRDKDTELDIEHNTKVWPLMWRGFAGPDYAPGALKGSKLWDKDNDGIMDEHYNGLSSAVVGDFMIYDETLLDGKGKDARYRRHIAFVESTNAVDSRAPDVITVSEKNWGKNQDSCGNTDRHDKRTTRVIRREFTRRSLNTGDIGLCDDPDRADCWEMNWSRIKLYRPRADIPDLKKNDINNPAHAEHINHPRPICEDELFGYSGTGLLKKPIEDAYGNPLYQWPWMPKIFTEESLDFHVDRFGNKQPVTPMEYIALYTPRELLSPTYDDPALPSAIRNIVWKGHAWKRYAYGSYDYDEVIGYLKDKIGRCDPPKRYRNSYNSK